ncbi:MAG: agmatinase [Chloroflexi bacterium]|nr:agmatinase [Chloroflexota bacterium]
MRFAAPTRPFLEATESATPAAIVLGAPLDLTECHRGGTREGPARVREASDVLESYSPVLRADLRDLPLADWGDVEFAADDMEDALDAIAGAFEQATGIGLPLMIGGEHTATIGGVRGALRRYPTLQVIHVDAHVDLRDEFGGRRLSHATVMRRVAEDVGFDRIAQYGIRSGTREEFEVARRCLFSGPSLRVDRSVLDRIHTRPVYLTIDIDVLDPSCAPGTGCPEPGGATFSELLGFVYSLRDLNVVAVDVMEVLPAADVNDITSIAAAKLIREAALLFAR